MIVRTFYNPPLSDYDFNSDEVVTIPDQSLSVREIIRRFTRDNIPLGDFERGDDEDIDGDDFLDEIDAFDALRDSTDYLSKQKGELGNPKSSAPSPLNNDKKPISPAEDNVPVE